MRLFGILAFVCLGLPLFSVAQTAQPQKPLTEQAPPWVRNMHLLSEPAAAQAPSSQPAPAQDPAQPMPRWRFDRVPVQKSNPDAKQLPEMRVDPGIYLRPSAGLDSRCAAILSYNFSPGENPLLQSITTCTPASSVRILKADHEVQQVPSSRQH
jgi:hypothetical protein